LILFIPLFFLLSCQEGLDPTMNKSVESFVKGNVLVISGRESWPSADSILELRVVGFKKFPPTDIIGEILSGEAYFTDTLPRFIDTIPYVLKIDKPPVDLSYLVCAYRYGTIMEWRVAGVYSDDTTYERTPKKLFVPSGKTISGVDIKVDFRNLPKQPF